jgi:23S rRNA pseudouridine2604 synthase
LSFYRRIKYFLVHTLMYSNKKAQEHIEKGLVMLDGKVVSENMLLNDASEIRIDGKIVREKKEFVYLKFNKPAGFESTLNTGIKDNLATFFSGYQHLSIAGRLDKQSEGLLILSNDGKWVEQQCNPKFEKEKEYLVTLDKNPDDNFIEAFTKGVLIGNYLTKPCKCYLVNSITINVVLTEGKNRQIRRMCKALGYHVIKLQRIRIADMCLNALYIGEIEQHLL